MFFKWQQIFPFMDPEDTIRYHREEGDRLRTKASKQKNPAHTLRQARKHLQEVLSLGGDDEDHAALGSCCQNLAKYLQQEEKVGLYREAIAAYRSAARQNPSSSYYASMGGIKHRLFLLLEPSVNPE